MRAITHATAVLALIAPALSACADVEQDAPVAAGPASVAVQPRVVMDGLVALAARADRVAVDEVLFHAPVVTQQRGDRVLTDVLASDTANEDALLFRYDAANADAFGDVLGGERRWTLDERGDLVFGFEPLVGDQQDIQALEQDTGVNLAELVGHTAVVHGYFLTQSPGGRATADGFSNPCEGDPDGNPATCRGKKTGDKADGDPDGNPAHPGGGRGVMDGDPDGNPAHPVGGKGEGDPDGNPSTDTEHATRGKHVDTGLAAEAVVGIHDGASYASTPFFLVLDDEFALRAPATSLFQDDLGADQVLPIDLHVQLDALLSDDMLRTLDEKASDGTAGAIVVQVPNGKTVVGIDVQATGVTRVRQTVTSGGIRVTGDHR